MIDLSGSKPAILPPNYCLLAVREQNTSGTGGTGVADLLSQHESNQSDSMPICRAIGSINNFTSPRVYVCTHSQECTGGTMRMYCGIERVFGLIAPSDFCIGSFASLCRALTHTHNHIHAQQRIQRCMQCYLDGGKLC